MTAPWPPTCARDLVAYHEGRRNVPYYDSLGFPTNGIGHKLSGVKYANLAQFAVATDAQVDAWFDGEDLPAAEAECARIFGPAWTGFVLPRQGAFVDMAFELGEAGLGGFHQAVQAAVAGDWAACATYASQSLWDRQVPHRAKHDEAILRAGEWAAVLGV